MTRIRSTALLAGLAGLLPACGGHSSSDAHGGAPGSSGDAPSTGGVSSGASGQGSRQATGGIASGGTTATSGAPSGGAAVTGGTATGGIESSGGVPAAAGDSGSIRGGRDSASTGGDPSHEGGAGAGAAGASGGATEGSGGAAPTAGSGGASGGGGAASGGSGAGGIATGGIATGGQVGEDPESSAFATAIHLKLDGFLFLAPCATAQGVRRCFTLVGACPSNDDPSLKGVLLTDQTFSLGGNPALTYQVTLHVQGVTEAKAYESGVDQLSSGTQSLADGFCVDGTPDPGTERTVFMIRVGAPAHDYFLNSIATESDPRTRNSVFPVDYQANIRIQGGTTLRLVASDPNCSSSRNCADPESDSVCNPVTVANVDPKIRVRFDGQPYDGQFLGLAVTNVTIVP